MFRTSLVTLSLLAALAAPAAAQLQVFGGDAPRMASTRIFWNNGPVGMVCVQYGQPDWKAEYDGMMDQLVGKQLRLGKDYWTTMNTTCALTIGGTRVAPGSYYLGLKCDDEGAFHLLVMRAESADKKGWAPFVPEPWVADYAIPMTRTTAPEAAAKMQVSIGGGTEVPTDLEFSIHWGTHRISAPAKAHLDEQKKEAPAAPAARKN